MYEISLKGGGGVSCISYRPLFGSKILLHVALQDRAKYGAVILVLEVSYSLLEHQEHERHP